MHHSRLEPITNNYSLGSLLLLFFGRTCSLALALVLVVWSETNKIIIRQRVIENFGPDPVWMLGS